MLFDRDPNQPSFLYPIGPLSALTGQEWPPWMLFKGLLLMLLHGIKIFFCPASARRDPRQLVTHLNSDSHSERERLDIQAGG